MNIKYCLPIIEKDKEKILILVEENIKEYDFFEVWVDYIENLHDEFIKKLSQKLKEKLIIVFRRQQLAKTKLSVKNRKQLIELLAQSKSFVDLDIVIQKEELDYIKDNRIKIQIITSYHNYHYTPNDQEIKKIIEVMKKYNPAIFKIATFCNNQKDALRLLGLLISLKEKKVKYIILGMGQHGIISRIFGSIWGNEMVFAPKNKSESSAPGQLTRNDLQLIFNSIEK